MMGRTGNDPEIQRGLAALRENDTLAALPIFEKACRTTDDPVCSSCLGYCIARERGQLKRGAELCRSAIARDPATPLHRLNLARVLLLAGAKPEAIAVLRDGMHTRQSPELAAELERLGTRLPPVFGSLSRGNFLNLVAGILLTRLGLRRGAQR
jgi:predicted Zn-dependent protease